MKRFFKVILLLLCLILCASSLLIWALLQVPDDYQQRIEIAPEIRTQKLATLKVKTEKLVDEIKTKQVWSFELTEDEANSWLSSEQFDREVGNMLPQEVSEPRVKMIDDAVQLSFQITHQEWSGVVTVQLKIVKLKRQEITLQVDSLRAGVLPISLKDLFSNRINADELPLNLDWNQTESSDQITLRLPNENALQGEVDSIRMLEGMLKINGRQIPEDEEPAE